LENSSNAERRAIEPQPPARLSSARPAAARPPAPAQARLAAGPDTLESIAVIEQAIQDIRPYLQRDGGDCELVDVEGNTIYVKLKGACVGCHMASMTVAGVQERLMTKLGVPLRVIPVG
jgi:NifU-like protein